MNARLAIAIFYIQSMQKVPYQVFCFLRENKSSSLRHFSFALKLWKHLKLLTWFKVLPATMQS